MPSEEALLKSSRLKIFEVMGDLVYDEVRALKVASILEHLIGYHSFGFRASDWSALICILS